MDTPAERRKKYAPIDYCVDAYGISRRSWYDILGAAKVKAVKCGGRTLIDLESADAYFAALPSPAIRAPRERQPVSA